MKTIICFFVFSASYIGAYGQEITMNGTVKEAITINGQTTYIPIHDAYITAPYMNPALTGQNGFFKITFRELPPNSLVELTVKKDGFTVFQKKVTLYPNKSIEIVLKRSVAVPVRSGTEDNKIPNNQWPTTIDNDLKKEQLINAVYQILRRMLQEDFGPKHNYKHVIKQISKADSLFQKGKLDEAIALLNNNSLDKLLKISFSPGGQGPNREAGTIVPVAQRLLKEAIHGYNLKAEAYVLKHQLNKAIETLRLAVSGMQKRPETKQYLHQLYQRLAELSITARQLNIGVNYSLLALAQAKLTGNPMQLALAYSQAAHTCLAASQMRSGLNYQDSAMAIWPIATITNCEDTIEATFYTKMGINYFYTGRLTLADSLLQYVVSTYKGHCTTSAMVKAQAYKYLCAIHTILNHNELAISFGCKAQSLENEMQSPSYPDLIYKTQIFLGAAYARAGFHVHAIELLNNSIEQLNKIGLAQSSQMGHAFFKLGNAYFLQSNYEQAEHYQKKGLATLKSILPKGHPYLVYYYSCYARTLLQLNRINRAHTYASSALTLGEHSLPNGHYLTAEAALVLAKTNLAQHLHLNTIHNLKLAKGLFEKLYADNHPLRIEAQQLMLFTYYSKDGMTTLLPHFDPAQPYAQLLLSDTYFRRGKFTLNKNRHSAEALYYFHTAIELAQKHNEKEFLARCYKYSGKCYQKLGDNKKATMCFKKARKLKSATHPKLRK